MNDVRILPDALRDRIRAGEVVERPASVIKELIENSIDAGARSIEVTVEDGGRKLISVWDDGAGMERENALLSIRRHATSKLPSEEALFSISTMGFRGEALPSIASVSKMTLTTALKGAASGTKIYIEGGEVKEVRDAPASGTRVEAAHIFYNTPARKKFLKTKQTEQLHIINTHTRAALAWPKIAFRLVIDQDETSVFPASSSRAERLRQVFGAEFTGELLHIEALGGSASMEGFTSPYEGYRSTRSHQYVFVNQRPVSDKTVAQAVYGAYSEALPKGRHPIYFIFIDMDPGEVDFNVHPTKAEVRFSEKEAIFRLVIGSIKSALRKTVQESPMPDFGGNEPGTYSYGHQSRKEPAEFTPSTGASHIGQYSKGAYSDRPSYDESPLPLPPSTGFSALSPKTEIKSGKTGEALEFAYTAQRDFLYLGDTFVAVPGSGPGVTIIDHHAAHERVLYEKLLNGVGLESHRLLFPRRVRLSPAHYNYITKNSGELSEIGIEVEDFGTDTVIVRALPKELEHADMEGVLSDAAEALMQGNKADRKAKEELSASIACHCSVRGKRILLSEELSALIKALDECDDPGHCPHGRPTRIIYSLGDLKKLFKRI